jgi:putative restriction endonuclease
MSELIEKPQPQDLAYYCKCFANLNVNSNKIRGKSPHKPILLLSVLELIAQGSIVNNRILVSDELIEIFNRYWDSFVGSDSGHQSGIHYPFTHLRLSLPSKKQYFPRLESLEWHRENKFKA